MEGTCMMRVPVAVVWGQFWEGWQCLGGSAGLPLPPVRQVCDRQQLTARELSSDVPNPSPAPHRWVVPAGSRWSSAVEEVNDVGI